MSAGPQLLATFYGDDFTGATDAMEALAVAGVPTILFLDPPDLADLRQRFPDVRAVGIAGTSRALTPTEMDVQLPAIFEKMNRLGARLVHYKVCSTFDSSPEIGSIGRAIDVGQSVFRSPFVALVVGVPVLRRYCVFGNLFASVGDQTFRLDRHPTMSRHPVTPMREGDLRVHLSDQTDKSVALFDILHLTGTSTEVDHRFARMLETQPDIVLFDVLDEPMLTEVGRLIWRQATCGTMFVVGSSGVEYALTRQWTNDGILSNPTRYPLVGPADRLVVVSGSCSPVTEQQIRWAVDHGFATIPVDTVKLVDRDHSAAEGALAVRQALDALADGRSVVLHACLGPHDPRLAAARLRRAENGYNLGDQLGTILKTVLEHTDVRRAVVVGGDTCGRVVRLLGVSALEMIATTEPGAPLCRAYSADRRMDGLELILKGGQVGRAGYFENVLAGTAGE